MAARLCNRLGLVLILGCAACAPAAGETDGNGPAPEERSRVQVQNNGFADVNVFVLQSGMRLRLGTVTGMSRQTFRLPEQMAGNGRQVRIMADPVGGSRGYLSEAVLLTPGSDVDVRVNASLPLSTVSVWQR